MRFIIVTNNPSVCRAQTAPVQFIDGNYRDVLVAVRDLCHKGHKLLSHPLSGSVKPNETPYKSIMVSLKPGVTDVESIQLIEDAIQVCEHFPERREKWTERNLKDFMLIDRTLLQGSVESAEVSI